ncbi:hypothetical protein V474_07545 [Novosphingobium barchaimii LL02]|uniref:Uncharacterized protein n=1 Tax=Novosphingobium barchaimii LL02 TaxID=1114963 RepID=A0A0J7Y803_9SPHN|nr:hypothetical protein [Novosphingobium barchaimii]KMS59956.1 hypothetical protein V474_07545 [Novosphingobium barchaimii LL02]
MTPPNTPRKDEVREIAAKLTKAQREAVSSCFQDAARHAPYHMLPNTVANRKAFRDLLSAGFVTTEDGGFDLIIKRGHYLAMVCLTPLALSVKAYLKEHPRNAD